MANGSGAFANIPWRLIERLVVFTVGLITSGLLIWQQNTHGMIEANRAETVANRGAITELNRVIYREFASRAELEQLAQRLETKLDRIERKIDRQMKGASDGR